MTTNHKDLILKKLLNEDKGNEKILFEQYKLYVEMADGTVKFLVLICCFRSSHFFSGI